MQLQLSENESRIDKQGDLVSEPLDCSDTIATFWWGIHILGEAVSILSMPQIQYARGCTFGYVNLMSLHDNGTAPVSHNGTC